MVEITCSDFKNNALFIEDSINKITDSAIKETSLSIVPSETLIMVTRVSLGKFAFVRKETALNQDLTALLIDENKANKFFVYYNLQSLSEKIVNDGHGATVKGVTRDYVREIEIPLPPLEIQQQIVAEIEGYQNEIEDYKKGIEKKQEQIKNKINSVWGITE